MNVFELLGTIAINNKGANKSIDETTGKAKGLHNSMGNAFSKIGKGAVTCGKVVAKGMMTLGAAGATATAAIAKASISAYAEFEQLQGGVKKLFGEDVAKTVMANANKAFKTAGISANEYMEQATSFSASLISGLAGDTAAAAEMTDMAIRDMADNANTFGTDMASVQNAYQGFAKQNYTMLDNLALGYGGTAEEMARLINDSGVMGDNFVATAENVKDISFAKIIEAIHVVQTEMGIAGTTTAEATDTIAGSLNMFKATWTNLMTGLASDENIEPLVDAFFDAGQSVLTNIGKVLPKIGTNIVKMLKLTGQKIKTVWANNIWPAIQSFFKTTFGIELPDWDTLVQNVSDGWKNVVWPRIQKFFKVAFGIELPAWTDVGTTISTLWNNLKSKISGWFTKTFTVDTEGDSTGVAVGKKIRAWWDGALKWIGDRFNAVFEVKPEQARSAGEKVRAWWEGVKTFIGDIFKGIFSVEPGDATGTATAESIRNWFNHVSTLFDEFLVGFFGIEPAEGETASDAVNRWWWDTYDEWAGKLSIKLGIELPTSEEIKEAVANFYTELYKFLGLPGAEYGLQAWGLRDESDFSNAPISSYSPEQLEQLQRAIDKYNEVAQVQQESEDVKGIGKVGAGFNTWKTRIAASTELGKVDPNLLNAYTRVADSMPGSNAKNWPSVSEAILAESSQAALQEELDGMGLETEVAVTTPSGTESALQTELNGMTLTVPAELLIKTGYVDELTKYNPVDGIETPDGSNASGLRYVPYDGYISELHLGEAVLPRNEAEEWRNGKSGSGSSSALETALNSLISLTQQLVSNTASGNSVYLDTGVLVGQLTPSIDSRLGTLTSRKERRS